MTKTVGRSGRWVDTPPVQAEQEMKEVSALFLQAAFFAADTRPSKTTETQGLP